VFGELAKIIVKSGRGTAIKPGPKSGLADGLATRSYDFDIVIRYPADHVGMWLDVFQSGNTAVPGATRRFCGRR